MTIRECYEQIGADFEDVKRRLASDERIEKFFLMFTRDPSYNELVSAMESGDAATAFRMAHTLKGVAGNLSLTDLGSASSELCESLREGSIQPEAAELYARVKESYERAMSAAEVLKQGRQ